MNGAGYGFKRHILAITGALAAFIAPLSPVQADDLREVRTAFDSTFGTEMRGPRTYSSELGQKISALANASDGRIGVAAIDLSTGRAIDVLGDQRFPMASTSKVAIAATFLEGVDQGRWSLDDRNPMMMPVASKPFSTSVAPVRAGPVMTNLQLLTAMLTHSNNYATDGLLRIIGGPRAVNAWVQRAGITDWHIDHDIATLVRDDGARDPARVVSDIDSASPRAMVSLLSGLYQGRWLTASSRNLLMDIMGRCLTGRNRIKAGMPEGVSVAHKTGSLNNTSSDIGIIQSPDGHAIAVAIYVTGQGSRPAREARIASIARGIYDGYQVESPSYLRTASR